MDRAALADLLRSRRERLAPADVGLPAGVRRRTPGLRRDEVAGLAVISTDYYTRLEQQRGPKPSADVLASLARALRLTNDERAHLFHLAGQALPPAHGGSAHLSPGLLHLLDRFTDCPVMIVDDLGVVLRQNAMSVAVTGNVSTLSGRSRYAAWRWFCESGARDRIPQQDWSTHSRTQVAELRATHGRRAGDPAVEELVASLRAGSTEFAGLWDEHDVAVRRSDAKRVIHPEVGLLDLLCETLVSAVGGQTIVILYPRPGTGTQEKLDLLRVIGLQNLSVAP